MKALLVLLLLTVTAQAGEPPARPRAALGLYTGMFTFTGEERWGSQRPQGTPARSLGLRLSVRAWQDLWIDLDAGAGFSDLAGGHTVLTDHPLPTLRLRGRHEVKLERLRPFLALGVGRMAVLGEKDEPIYTLEAGGGLVFDLTGHIGLRFDVFARKPVDFAGVASEAQLGVQLGF